MSTSYASSTGSKNMKKVAKKTVRIRLETHQRLIKKGTSGDTMDDEITEFLDLTENWGEKIEK
jgi:hypothetical protein